MKKSFWSAALLAGVLLAPLSRATMSFNTNPANGIIAGDPGQTIGWGFTLFNDTDYIVVTSTVFTQLTGPGIGTYTDIISGEFFPVGPATTETWTQSFDPNIPTGLAEFTINPAVASGTVITGTIQVFFDIFSDPQALNFVGSGNFTPNFIEIDVVPEPGTLLSAGGALVLAGFLYLRRQRRGWENPIS